MIGFLREITDCRLGGQPRYVLAHDERFLVQVPDEVRRCVVFLHSQHEHGRAARGTAFFVSVPFSNAPDRYFVYLVTARHVIDQIRAHGSDGKVHIRANLTSGGFGWLETSPDQWIVQPEDAPEYIDVAVLPYAPSPALVEYLTLPRSMFATPAAIEANEIGLGDELFMTGLFVSHYGKNRNIPIVRIGNIAAMPDEPVVTDLGPMVAYLAESRSLGGLSGSPAFVSIGPVRVTGGGTSLGARQFFLLGLMRGHWDAQLGAEDAVSDNQSRRELVNMGVAIVVPISKIEEILNLPILQSQRQRQESESQGRGLPTEDAATMEGDPFHA